MDTLPLIHPVLNEVCVRDQPLLAVGTAAAVGEIGEACSELEQAENDKAAAAMMGAHFLKVASPIFWRVPRAYCSAPLASAVPCLQANGPDVSRMITTTDTAGEYGRNSGGGVEKRYIITTLLKLGEESWPIELALANRDQMGFRMLLGRTALESRALIEPGRSFLLGGRPARLRRRHTPSSRANRCHKPPPTRTKASFRMKIALLARWNRLGMIVRLPKTSRSPVWF